MKHVRISLCLWIAISYLGAGYGQNLTNKGTLYISNSSDVLYIGSAFNNTSSALLTNNGTVYLKGNLTNDQAAMAASTGSFVFNGSTLQTIQGTQLLKAYNVNASNSTGIRLGQSLQVVNNIVIEGAGFDLDTMKLLLGGSMLGQGIISAKKGTLELAGTTAQTIPAAILKDNTVSNLVISNEEGATLNGLVNIINEVVVSKGHLTTQGYLTLKSGPSASARIAQITSVDRTPISGNVTVERYISPNRAFRLLTSPVNTSRSIKTNWMEGVNNTAVVVNNNPVPGYGTNISGYGGAVNGFDVTNSNNPSLFTYSSGTQTWGVVANTYGKLNAGIGYRLMVRGDRSIDLTNNNPTATATILRTTGTILTGPVTMTKAGGGGTTGMPDLSSADLGYTLIGNPYASPINWNTVTKNNISPTIYIYDPTLMGANGRGAFVTYNELLGTNNNPSSQADNYIQSGQAFMVQTSGSNPTITFRESDKVNKLRQVFKTAKMPKLTLQLFLPQNINKRGAADAVSILFHPSFNDSVGIEDSYKINNMDENIAIDHDGKLLSIEGCKPVDHNDTLNLRMSQLSQKSYVLISTLTAFDPSTIVYLEDTWKHALTRLYNDSVQQVPFAITADTGSSSEKRFRVVFSKPESNNLDMVVGNFKKEVKLEETSIEKISVYPNPAQNSTINLFLKNCDVGTYSLVLINASGQIMYTGSITHNSQSGIYTINLANKIKGACMLRITYGAEVKVLPVLIE